MKKEKNVNRSDVESITGLSTALWASLPDEVANWLKSALDEISESAHDINKSSELQLRYSAMVRRKSGTSILVGYQDTGSCSCHWQLDEAARVILLEKLLDVSLRNNITEQINTAYKMGDEYEKIAIIKGLGLLDSQGNLVNLMLLTGRTNNINLFAACALNNPYPAAHYNDRAYHQLVLKALFMGLDITGMSGLQQRLNPELSLLCIDLVKERLLADRVPPYSISSAINSEHLSADDKLLYQRCHNIHNKEELKVDAVF